MPIKHGFSSSKTNTTDATKVGSTKWNTDHKLSTTVTTLTTAGAITYAAAELYGGLILRDCNGAGRADLVPTAAALLAVMPATVAIGDTVEVEIRNTSDAAETITVTTNTGVTLSGTMTITQNNTRRFKAVFTNVTASSEAYTLYSLGTAAH